MKIHLYYVYILTNTHHTVFYTGVTNNLTSRSHQHKEKVNVGFTSKYNVDKLVYYEVLQYIDMAIRREKQIKGYSRQKKLDLINKFNPEFFELIVDGRVVRPSDIRKENSND